jgi:hypothetical protein
MTGPRSPRRPTRAPPDRPRVPRPGKSRRPSRCCARACCGRPGRAPTSTGLTRAIAGRSERHSACATSSSWSSAAKAGARRSVCSRSAASDSSRTRESNRSKGRIGSSHAARSDSTHPTPRARVVAGRAARRRRARAASGGRSDAHRRLDNARQRVLGVDPPRRIPDRVSLSQTARSRAWARTTGSSRWHFPFGMASWGPRATIGVSEAPWLAVALQLCVCRCCR